MKKLLTTTFLLIFTLISYSQVAYVDAVTSAAITSSALTLKSAQNKTNDNLTLIEKGQLAVMGQLGIANDLQNKIYKGLTQVSGTLTNAYYVKEIYNTADDLVKNTAEAVKIAVGNPMLTLFAERNAIAFKNRALRLSTEIASILTSGENNMMDAGERQKLIYHIYTELRLLNATAFSIKNSMYYAKMNGIWNSLNPFRMWVNQDLAIMKDILRKMDGI